MIFNTVLNRIQQKKNQNIYEEQEENKTKIKQNQEVKTDINMYNYDLWLGFIKVIFKTMYISLSPCEISVSL